MPHAEALMHADRARNSAGRMIFSEVARMEVGQRYRVEANVMRDAFPMHSPDGRRPEDQFLEKMMGANYGAWTCELSSAGDYYVIGHHEEDDKIVRQDWDRRFR